MALRVKVRRVTTAVSRALDDRAPSAEAMKIMLNVDKMGEAELRAELARLQVQVDRAKSGAPDSLDILRARLRAVLPTPPPTKGGEVEKLQKRRGEEEEPPLEGATVNDIAVVSFFLDNNYTDSHQHFLPVVNWHV